MKRSPNGSKQRAWKASSSSPTRARREKNPSGPGSSRYSTGLVLHSARAHDVAGEAAGELTVEHDRLAVDDRGLDALAPCLEPPDVAGQVAHELLLPRGDGGGVEDHHVRPPPDSDGPAVDQADDGGGDLGDLADALLERPHAPVEHPVAQEVGGPVGAVVT